MDQNFIDLLLKNIADLKAEISIINKKVDLIMGYKNQIWGGAIVLSFIVTLMLHLATKLLT